MCAKIKGVGTGRSNPLSRTDKAHQQWLMPPYRCKYSTLNYMHQIFFVNFFSFHINFTRRKPWRIETTDLHLNPVIRLFCANTTIILLILNKLVTLRNKGHLTMWEICHNSTEDKTVVCQEKNITKLGLLYAWLVSLQKNTASSQTKHINILNVIKVWSTYISTTMYCTLFRLQIL